MELTDEDIYGYTPKPTHLGRIMYGDPYGAIGNRAERYVANPKLTVRAMKDNIATSNQLNLPIPPAENSAYSDPRMMEALYNNRKLLIRGMGGQLNSMEATDPYTAHPGFRQPVKMGSQFYDQQTIAPSDENEN